MAWLVMMVEILVAMAFVEVAAAGNLEAEVCLVESEVAISMVVARRHHQAVDRRQHQKQVHHQTIDQEIVYPVVEKRVEVSVMTAAAEAVQTGLGVTVEAVEAVVAAPMIAAVTEGLAAAATLRMMME